MEYANAGAKIVDLHSAFGADIVLKVRAPNLEQEVPLFKRHSAIVSYIHPSQNNELVEALRAKGMTVVGIAHQRLL